MKTNKIHGLVIFVAFSSMIEVIESFIDVPGLGSCPRTQVMQNFDLSNFLGTWYAICSYPDKLALDAKCASATFTWAQNQADGVSIFSRHVSFGKEKKFMGFAKIVTSGVLGVEFPCCPKANAYYNILDTDYNNYAVIFSCNNYFGLANGQNVWILGRRKMLEPQFTERAMHILNINGISKLLLKHIDQNCENIPVYSAQGASGSNYGLYGRPY